jgi:hypothetical protein
MADFIRVALSCGGRAHHWSQSDYLGEQTFGKKGVCGPLALKWIKDRRHKIDFKKDTESDDGREEIMQLKLNQSAKKPNWDSEYLKLFGIYEILTLVYPNPVSTTEVLKFLSAGAGYYYISLSNFGVVLEPTAHAFAIDMYDHKFFDPNYGQAHFKNVNDLKNFFVMWFLLAYLDLCGNASVTWYC